MNKLILTIAIALTLSGCVVGPPNYNERDRRAYNSLEDTRDDRYYHDRHDWHDDRDHDHDDDYNPHDGHDHWARQSN